MVCFKLTQASILKDITPFMESIILSGGGTIWWNRWIFRDQHLHASLHIQLFFYVRTVLSLHVENQHLQLQVVHYMHMNQRNIFHLWSLFFFCSPDICNKEFQIIYFSISRNPNYKRKEITAVKLDSYNIFSWVHSLFYLSSFL